MVNLVYSPGGIDIRDAERDVGVLHPEIHVLVTGKNKYHAGINREFFPEHEAFRACRVCSRDFRFKCNNYFIAVDETDNTFGFFR